MPSSLLRHAVLLLLLASPTALASDGPEPTVTPPPPPESLRPQDESVEPKVTILRRAWATIEEYSIGGRIYAVKIIPRNGPPYYLYDSDGDGSLETRRDVNPEMPEFNRWQILTW